MREIDNNFNSAAEDEPSSFAEQCNLVALLSERRAGNSSSSDRSSVTADAGEKPADQKPGEPKDTDKKEESKEKPKAPEMLPSSMLSGTREDRMAYASKAMSNWIDQNAQKDKGETPADNRDYWYPLRAALTKEYETAGGGQKSQEALKKFTDELNEKFKGKASVGVVNLEDDAWTKPHADLLRKATKEQQNPDAEYVGYVKVTVGTQKANVGVAFGPTKKR